MIQRRRISYDLKGADPGFPGNPTLKVEAVSRIADGGVANTYQVQLFNHFGSHMDGERHFNDNGRRLAEMPLEHFFYDRPLVVDIPKSYAELVTSEDLRAFEAEIRDCDLLLIRSGFAEKRSTEPEKYSNEGPGITVEGCRYLCTTFPQLKAIGMDWISLASVAHLEIGLEAHRELLGNYREASIGIIEDIDLRGLDNRMLQRVMAIPLFIEEIDSSPVTVIAEISEIEG